jgi:hypothetical protein
MGYWLLVIGYWLLVIGYWLLVIGYYARNHFDRCLQFLEGRMPFVSTMRYAWKGECHLSLLLTINY